MQEYRTPTGTLVKIWVRDLQQVEPQSRQQLEEMGRLPFVHGHIAVMPDVHLGQGAVVGSVFPARNAVVPNIVGVDIGCGISAYDTGIARSQVEAVIQEQGQTPKEFWKRWENQVSRDVPTGFHQHKTPHEWEGLRTVLRASSLRRFMEEKVAYQLGTLGGGNHFIEAQTDEQGHFWFMAHSGSRHTGLQIAEHYNREAEALLGKRNAAFPRHLAYLPGDNRLFEDYLHDMEWAVSFALENRWRMLERAVLHFLGAVGGPNATEAAVRKAVRQGGINIHHNFARLEEHGGQQVIVHRKGATSALEGEIGIIPGSMATGSYIVRGKGNPESFRSCSHGAGRVMSRRQARREIAQKAYEQALAGTFTKPSMNYVDEAPQTYKDIAEVIENQADLIEVVHHLRPIITIKGDSKASVD